MNLGEKMGELVELLRKKGFEGIRFPEIRKSCEDGWTADYAIVDGAYGDTFAIENDWEGFDYQKFLDGFDRFLAEFFGPDVLVNHRRGCQEIEVCPKKNASQAVLVSVDFGQRPIMAAHEKRIIGPEELAKSVCYQEMAALGYILQHHAVETDDAIWRWHQNAVVRWLFSNDNPRKIDLNTLWLDFHHGKGHVLEMMKLYMQLGYSLSGFYEIFGQVEAAEWKLPGALLPAGGDSYTETPIDYAIRVYNDKTMRV